MYSIGFPEMFSNSRTILVKDREAVISNLKLLLLSDKGSLFGDPYFGTQLKKVIYEQNDTIVNDLVVDEIYTAILMFMPQIKVSRNDIKVYSDGTTITATIKCIYLVDYTTDMYSINLTKTNEV